MCYNDLLRSDWSSLDQSDSNSSAQAGAVGSLARRSNRFQLTADWTVWRPRACEERDFELFGDLTSCCRHAACSRPSVELSDQPTGLKRSYNYCYLPLTLRMTLVLPYAVSFGCVSAILLPASGLLVPISLPVDQLARRRLTGRGG